MAGYLLIRRLTASVTGPLKTLSASMALASDSDFDLVLECMGDDFSQDEVGQLASEYREMIIRIQKLIRENYEKQLLLNDSRYRMLRAQMNPHFLYNTLNSAGWMIKLGRQDEAVRMVQALGSLMHRANDRSMLVSLGGELALLEDYDFIQAIRYSSKMKCTIEKDESLSEEKIPPLIIQSLVENALVYGPDVTGEHVDIAVRVRDEAGFIVITVSDNGPGFTPERLAQVRSMAYKGNGSGIGLKNIHDRLALLYPDTAGLELESGGGKTVITIRIPKEGEDVQRTGG